MLKALPKPRVFSAFFEKMQYVRLRRHWLHCPKTKACAKIFWEIYLEIDGVGLSKMARKTIGDGPQFHYGEIELWSFLRLLTELNPLPGTRFYDLGAGVGKACAVAGLFFDCEVVGIEKLTAVQEAGANALAQIMIMRQSCPVLGPFQHTMALRHGDIGQCDWREAELVFCNATTFFGQEWELLQEKLCALKPGTRVILTSKTLPAKAFSLLDNSWRWMSWGQAVVFIYQRN